MRLWRMLLDPPMGSAGLGPPTRTAGPEPPAEAKAVARSSGHWVDGLLALGAGELWPALGLVQDLVTLTGPRSGRVRFNDERVRVLVDDPGVERLRGLGWPARARVAFAALLAGPLTQAPGYIPPAGAESSVSRGALQRALAARSGLGRPSALLISAAEPETAVPLARRSDLARLWTTRTLNPPWPVLGTALEHARATDLPVVLLTHHFTPRGRYVPAERTRLLTSHHPPEDSPDTRPGAYHRHLPPAPALTELTEAVTHLLARR
jgi:hypothetical protein